MDPLSFFPPHPNFAPGTSLDHATNGHSLSSTPSFFCLLQFPSGSESAYTSYRPGNRPDSDFLFFQKSLFPFYFRRIGETRAQLLFLPWGRPVQKAEGSEGEKQGHRKRRKRGGRGSSSACALPFYCPLGEGRTDVGLAGGRETRERERCGGRDHGATYPYVRRTVETEEQTKQTNSGGGGDGETTTWK